MYLSDPRCLRQDAGKPELVVEEGEVELWRVLPHARGGRLLHLDHVSLHDVLA